jgi:methylated-DNA-[protein]-cysteine S-methyltransferase
MRLWMDQVKKARLRGLVASLWGGSIDVRKPPAGLGERAYIHGMSISYSLFETAIGWAGLAWNEAGLVAVHLPEREAERARKSFLRRIPDATEGEAPAEIAAVQDAIRALLADGKADLTAVRLDLSRVPDFNARVYEIARAIPAGETLTYGEIAVRLGDKLLARDVGQALGQNPWPIVVPCHRVTAAGGKLGGFSARGGQQTKLKLLAIEGAPAAANQPAAQADLFA